MTHYRRAYFHDLNRTGESPAEDGTDFRELLENASDFIYTTDRTGKFTSVNGAGERLTGYSRAELIASSLGQIVAPESLDTVLRIMDQMAKGATPTICELDVVAKDGRKVLVEVNAQPIYRDGNPVGVQGIAPFDFRAYYTGRWERALGVLRSDRVDRWMTEASN